MPPYFLLLATAKALYKKTGLTLVKTGFLYN